MAARKSIAERFWSKVKRAGSNECWEWAASRNRKGYGQFWFQGAMVASHRVAWMLFYGPIPCDLWALHHCDNPPCCNPDHLWLGTNADNAADMRSKGRARDYRGESNSYSKLTDDAVGDIRTRHGGGENLEALATAYGVTKSAICAVTLRRTWNHVH